MKMTREGIAVIDGDEYLSADIERAGRLDVAAEYLEEFRRYIPVGAVVLDVGACLGDYTVTFAEMVGPGGIVVAVEPNPPVFECLKHNLKGYANVIVGDCALGARKGAATFDVDARNIGASRIIKDPIGPVAVMALDDIWNWERGLDFIKIDAEGCEPEILDGAVETIGKFRPVMLIEIDTRALGRQGYVPEDVFVRLDRLEYEFERFGGPHGNILCVPKEVAIKERQ